MKDEFAKKSLPNVRGSHFLLTLSGPRFSYSIPRRWLGYLLFLAMLGFGNSPRIEAEDIFEMNRRLGRGINFGNVLDAPRDANWAIKILDRHFVDIQRAGFQSIRVPVKWSDYALVKAPYTIDSEIWNRVDHFLEQAESNGLYVVLNCHHYEEFDREPLNHFDRFLEIWRQIADRYRNRSKYLLFEFHNEPNNALTSPLWNEMFAKVLKVVRQSNPVRPVIVGPTQWNGLEALHELKLPEDPNLIVSFHYYHPFEFTHQGAFWTEPKIKNIVGREWQGSKSDWMSLRSELEQVSRWGKENRRPIFLGEFGTYERVPLGSRIRWMSAVSREAERLEMSWAYWEFASNFGIYDLGRSAWRRPMLDALVPPTKVPANGFSPSGGSIPGGEKK